MRRILDRINILPRWVIASIDVFIIFWGYVFATLIRFNFDLVDASRWLDGRRVVFYLMVHIAFMLVYKPFRGIVRYTHKQDILSVIKTLAFAFLVLALSNLIIRTSFPSRHLIPLSIIIMGFFVNSAFLIGYRFTVKEFFDNRLASLGKRKKVIIYGAGATGRLTGRILQESTTEYRLVQYLDDDPKMNNSKIQGVEIKLPAASLQESLSLTQVDEIIIATRKLPQERRNWIIDGALEMGIQIKEVPPPDRWVGGHLSERQFREVRIEDLLGRKEIDLASENMIQAFSGKVVLITGAAGSIGSEISRQVLYCGIKKLLILDKSESDLYDLQQELLLAKVPGDFELILGDIRDIDQLELIFSLHKPQIVFHAAAYKHVPIIENQPAVGIETNLFGTMNVADLAEKYSAEKFIFVSTDKAVNPTNVMGATKRAAECYIQALSVDSKVEFITTRFGNVLGSNGSLIPLIRRQIEKGGPITVTHPDITRFFMTIPEACSLVLEAGAMGNGGEILVFDMGQPVKILDLVKKMVRLSGLEIGRDIDLEIIGLRPGEKLHEEVLSNLENLKPTHHDKIMIADVVKIRKEHVIERIQEIQRLMNQEAELVRSLKKLVPEFLSQNSRFEELDKSSKS